jgi:hypothetical protein
VTVKPGKCMSYSDHPYDYTYGYCANNVNAAAADLLFRAHQAGFSGSGPGTYGSDDQGTHECGSRHC